MNIRAYDISTKLNKIKNKEINFSEIKNIHYSQRDLFLTRYVEKEILPQKYAEIVAERRGLEMNSFFKDLKNSGIIDFDILHPFRLKYDSKKTFESNVKNSYDLWEKTRVRIRDHAERKLDLIYLIEKEERKKEGYF
jgi:hypothetical protein